MTASRIFCKNKSISFIIPPRALVRFKISLLFFFTKESMLLFAAYKNNIKCKYFVFLNFIDCCCFYALLSKSEILRSWELGLSTVFGKEFIINAMSLGARKACCEAQRIFWIFLWEDRHLWVCLFEPFMTAKLIVPHFSTPYQSPSRMSSFH